MRGTKFVQSGLLFNQHCGPNLGADFGASFKKYHLRTIKCYAAIYKMPFRKKEVEF